MTEERDQQAPGTGASDRAWAPPDGAPPPPAAVPLTTSAAGPPPPPWSGTGAPPPPTPPPDSLATYAQPTPPRRHPLRNAAAVLAALAVLVTGSVVVAQLGDEDGAASPEAAVEHLFSALEHEDAIGVLESLPPSERVVVGEPLRGLVGELQRLDVLADFDLHTVPGIDIEVDGLELDATELGEGVTVVRITGGTITGAAVPAELPVGDLIEDVAGDDLDLPDDEERDTAELADADLELVAVEEGGRWHVSLFYTLAEAARGDAPLPHFGDGIVPVGADTPEGAVEGLVDAAVELDAEAAIAMLPPDEMRVLYDYGPLFVDDADEAADEVREDGWEMTVDRLDLHAEGDGAERIVVLDGFDVSMEGGGDSLHATFDGECTTLEGRGMGLASLDGAEEKFVAVGEAVEADGPPEEGDDLFVPVDELDDLDGGGYDDDEYDDDALEVLEMCADGTMTIDGEDADLGPFGGAGGLGVMGLGQVSPRVTVVEVDGRWYVSPLRSAFDPLLGWLESVERSDLEGFVDDMESWMSEPEMQFEEVGEAIEGDGGFDLTDDELAAEEACWDLLEFDPNASGAAGHRQQYLMYRAVDDCLDDAGLDGAGPFMEECWDAYEALPADADEAAWVVADTEVVACFDETYGPTFVDAPRLVGGTVVVPELEGAFGFDPVTGEQRWRLRDCAWSSDWATAFPGNATDIEILECGEDLVAVEGATGTVLWRQPDDQARDRTRVGPTAMVAQSDGDVRVVDLRSGALLWSRDDLGSANVAVTATTVYVGNSLGVGAYDVATGTERWHVPVPVSGLAADEQQVVLRSNDWVVSFLDPATGAEVARAAEADPEGLAWSDVVAIADTTVVLSSTENGQLSAYGTDGSLRWTRTPDNEDAMGPLDAMAQGPHVVVTEGCEVEVLDASTGALLGAVTSDSCLGVAVAGGVVYLTDHDDDGRQVMRSVPIG